MIVSGLLLVIGYVGIIWLAGNIGHPWVKGDESISAYLAGAIGYAALTYVAGKLILLSSVGIILWLGFLPVILALGTIYCAAVVVHKAYTAVRPRLHPCI